MTEIELADAPHYIRDLIKRVPHENIEFLEITEEGNELAVDFFLHIVKPGSTLSKFISNPDFIGSLYEPEPTNSDFVFNVRRENGQDRIFRHVCSRSL